MTSADLPRRVTLTRTGRLTFRATNDRGGTIDLGPGDDGEFSPVELLLAAIAGCTGMDVDAITGKRSQPDRFDLVVEGRKIRDQQGNRLVDLLVDFSVAFPDGEAGDAARAVLATAVQRSHDRLCTVSRTVEVESPIAVSIDGDPLAGPIAGGPGAEPVS
jgi:putative redox protein